MPSRKHTRPSPPGARKRRLNDWLESYIKFTQNTEPPLSFHVWSGISTLASALQRRAYMVWGHETIYPNQYIVLVGPSGKSRKGVAIGIARDLMQSVRISITAQRITREALYKFMKDSTVAFTDKTTRRYKFQCPVTAIATELQVFLGMKNVEFLAELTDWYDSLDEWTYETKWSGVDRIIGMCFNLLGGTAPDWLPSILPAEAVGGGFTSRIIFVVEEAKGKTVTNPNKYKEDLKLRDDLAYDLEQILLLSGEMKFTDEALAVYEKWYGEEDERLNLGTQDIVDPRLAGYNSRRATHVKKISMAISASRSNDLVITLEDFDRALTLMTTTEKKMPRVFTGLSRGRFAEAIEDVLYILASRRVITRSQILRENYLKIDTFVMDAVETMLEEMQVIKIDRTKGLGDKIYTYTGGSSMDLLQHPVPDEPS